MEQEKEKQMSKEELEAFWSRTVSKARKHLKQCSKNELVRGMIQMQIRCYELETQLQAIMNNQEGGSNVETDSASE